MEPFSKDDPLHSLLGKARPVEPRPNFTQNVMRAVRNEPQETKSFWMQAMSWLSHSHGPKLAFAALAVLLTVTALNHSEQEPLQENYSATLASTAPPAGLTDLDPPPSTADSSDAAVASELDSLDQLSDLLAHQDTDSFTDHQIAMLLY